MTHQRAPRYFIYGSLRRGQYNHGRFGFSDKAVFVRKAVLTGARLYDLGSYPCIVLTGDPAGQVVGELFDLDDPWCAGSIERMELGAGYETATVEIDSEDAITYVFAQAPENAILVESGDWESVSGPE